MTEDTSKNIRAIRACLEYLLIDIAEIGSERTARLIRLAITELDEMSDRDIDTARVVSRPSSLT
jgi:hypothetical protein